MSPKDYTHTPFNLSPRILKSQPMEKRYTPLKKLYSPHLHTVCKGPSPSTTLTPVTHIVVQVLHMNTNPPAQSDWQPVTGM